MAILGLLMLVAAGVVGGGLLIGGRDYDSDAHLFGQTVGGVGESGLVVTGIIIGLVASFGVALLVRAFFNSRDSRAVRRREEERLVGEREELARRVALEAETVYDLRVQRDALAEELEQTRAIPVQTGRAKHRETASR